VEVQLVEDVPIRCSGVFQHGELHLAVGVLRGDEGFQSRLLYPCEFWRLCRGGTVRRSEVTPRDRPGE